MRIRWFSVAGIFLLVAIWQGGMDASSGSQTNRFIPSAPLPEKAVKAEPNPAAIELVRSFPGRFIRFAPDDRGIETEEIDIN